MVKSGRITGEDRRRAWIELRRAAKENKTRPFYRATNKQGLMYAGNHATHALLVSSCNLSSLGIVSHSAHYASSEDGFAHCLIPH